MTREEFIREVESNQKAFRRFLAALCCGDIQLADDIAQDALVRAYLSCDSLADISRFRSWLYRIGFNTFFNNRRAHKFSVDYDEAPPLEAADRSDEAFRYQDLYAALNRIPERERTSILLFYMEGYSAKEISGIVDTSEENVRQHLSRGRNHLKKLLKHPQYEE